MAFSVGFIEHKTAVSAIIQECVERVDTLMSLSSPFWQGRVCPLRAIREEG